MTYTLGCVRNTKDLRDIQLTQVQTPVSLPDKYITDISFIPVFNQKSLGACVGYSHALIHIYNEYKENGKIKNLSPRYLYALSKKVDGLSQEGTYPRITAKIQNDKGCATEDKVINNADLLHADYINVIETPEITLDAKPYKTKGYAEVANNKEALKQALVQNKLVAITISVGNFDNPIKPGNIGLHRVVCWGYDGDRFFYRNSWGQEWGGNNDGNGYFDWSEQQLSDILVFVDLPNEVILEARKKYKYFSQKEVDKWKLTPELWAKLDLARDYANTSFRITSGLRSSSQNESAGGSPTSTHLSGTGCDISCTDSVSRYKITTGLLKAGFTRIGVYASHLHCDLNTDSVIWLSDKD